MCVPAPCCPRRRTGPCSSGGGGKGVSDSLGERQSWELTGALGARCCVFCCALCGSSGQGPFSLSFCFGFSHTLRVAFPTPRSPLPSLPSYHPSLRGPAHLLASALVTTVPCACKLTLPVAAPTCRPLWGVPVPGWSSCQALPGCPPRSPFCTSFGLPPVLFQASGLPLALASLLWAGCGLHA